eukprot:GEMP01004814.1.p1 GENE.GEMP01004814.1~~GEMP01004814.1.p1  ORF type:complete len:1022 (+),score=255.42 GEMP01004814.1:386-3451(+)
MDLQHLKDIGLVPVCKPAFEFAGKEVIGAGRTKTGASSASAGKSSGDAKQEVKRKSSGFMAGKPTAKEIRRTFVDFFVKKKAHVFVPSAPVVPHNDPTLLFINAGMNQFKPIFTGQIDPNDKMASYKRAVNSQKCIRAGGKHNDLDDVGFDVYHHTFFEMLGNWSFGDYFKKETIAWSWELLTEVYKLDKARLYVSYFGGDPKEPALKPDLEARDLWLEYLPAERILPFDMKDNFWEMGDTGPCGPCSEIHYDRIGGRDASALVNADDPDVLEIWNLVFMQFNREKDRSLTPLPAKSIDTGMGLERLVSVINDVPSNYDTDLFAAIFEEIQKITGARPYTRKVGKDDTDGVDMAYRVVADHIRTLTIALSDGAQLANEGRGYVLKRILRRAARYGREFLNVPKDDFFLAKLVDVVVDVLGDAFPEITEAPEDVKELIRVQEKEFGKCLEKGIKAFQTYAKNTPAGQKLSGEAAFQLCTTHGFPLDLTELMAKERGLAVDIEGFEQKMEEFKEISKKTVGDVDLRDLTLMADQTHTLRQIKGLPSTDDSLKYEWNSMGDGSEHEATLLAIWNGKAFVEVVDSDAGYVGFIFDRTPLYAEQGGQIFDVASAECKDTGVKFGVENCQKFAGYVVHMGMIESRGTAKVGRKFRIGVDFSRRALVAKNHTATHILNFALRRVLGSKVDQKGSLVDCDKLRFDFAWNAPVTLEQLKEIEKICNHHIQMELCVSDKDCDFNDAMAIPGLRAVFGEAYPNPVRVVSIGQEIDAMLNDTSKTRIYGEEVSVEFCGGTHVRNSKEVDKLILMSEEGVAKGIRRIVAYTGRHAAEEASLKAALVIGHLEDAKSLRGPALEAQIAKLRSQLEEDRDMPLTKKRDVLHELDMLKEKQIKAGKEDRKRLEQLAKDLGAQVQFKDDAPNIAIIEGLGGDAKALGVANDTIAKKHPTACFLVVSAGSEKCAILATVPKAWENKITAKDWVNAVCTACGGNGGGTKNKAQGQILSATADAEAVKKAAEQFACAVKSGA